MTNIEIFKKEVNDEVIKCVVAQAVEEYMPENYRYEEKDSYGWCVKLFELWSDEIGDDSNDSHEEIIKKIAKIIKSKLEEKYGIELYGVHLVADTYEDRSYSLSIHTTKEHNPVFWDDVLRATNNGFEDITIAYRHIA